MGKKQIIYGAVAAFVLLVAWVVMTIPSPPTKEEAKKAADKFSEYADQTIFEEKNGKRIWDLKMKKSKVSVQTNNAELFDIVGHYYTQDGKTITVTAPHGYYTDKTKDIVLDRKVKAVSSDGAVLTSEKLTWVAKKEILSAVGKARLVNAEYDATGDRLESWNGFREFRAAGNACIKKLVAKENKK